MGFVEEGWAWMKKDVLRYLLESSIEVWYA